MMIICAHLSHLCRFWTFGTSDAFLIGWIV